MKRGLESGTRIKTEFVDDSTNGESGDMLAGFRLNESSIPS
jgi:hypothetical protein